MRINALNALDDEEARRAFYKCCAAQRWAKELVARRPFGSAQELYTVSDQVWWQLDRDDWLQAFDGHPKIGDMDSLREKYGDSRSWSEGEQHGVDGASEEILQRLADGNTAYEEKFGYIFIVCATGKSASEMLTILEDRLPNDPDEEIKIAAGEQAKITRIRLEKLLDDLN